MTLRPCWINIVQHGLCWINVVQHGLILGRAIFRERHSEDPGNVMPSRGGGGEGYGAGLSYSSRV